MELYDFFKVIGKRKWLIITIIIIAFAASFVTARKAKPPSEARNILHFNFFLPQQVDVQVENEELAIPLEQHASDFVALFSTEGVIEEGIEREGLNMSVYAASKALNASVRVVKIGAKDERTSFIEVVARHRDADTAVKLVNGVTDAAVERYVEMLTRSVIANRKFLAVQVAEYRLKVKAHEDNLKAFLSEHPGFGQTDDDQSIATRKIQLDYSRNNLAAEISGLDVKIRRTEDDLEEYRDGITVNIPPAIKFNKSLESLQYKLTDMQVERSQLAGRYSADHPVMKRLDSEMEQAREELYHEVVRLLEEEIEVYRTQRQEKLSNLASFDGDLTELLTNVGEFAVDRIEYNSLIEDLRIDQSTYSRVKTKLAEAFIEENKAKERYSVDVVERAETARPRQELWFQPRFRITLSIIGGVFIALILAFFVEYISLKAAEVREVVSEPED